MKKNITYSLLILLVLTGSLMFYQYLLPDIQARYNHQKTLQDIEKMVAEMSLKAKVGQMLFPAFKGRTLNLDLEKLLSDVQPGGLIFFPTNLSGLKGTQGLIEDLQTASQMPLFIAIDQEGGLVQKLNVGISEVNDFPGAMTLGATGSQALSYRLARAMGFQLSHVGFNMVFAPVLDVNSNPENPVIGIRSFGSDPKLVAEMGVAFMDGLVRSGLIPVGKHFPGHGDTAADTHLGTAMFPYGKKRLDQLELIPFKAAIRNGIPALMTAHISIPELVSSGRPATLSSEILTQLLREELEYDGLIITDAMNMKAISSHFGQEESVIQAVQAGADLILMPIDSKVAHQALIKAIEKGDISEERIDRSVKRILYLKMTKGLFQPLEEKQKEDSSLWVEGREVAQEVANQAVTVVKDEAKILPLKLQESEKLVVITPLQSVTEIYLEELRNFFTDHQIMGLTLKNLALSSEQWQRIQEADRIIVATNSRTPSTRRTSHSQMQTIAKLGKMKPEQMIWISLQTPYELSTLPEMKTYLAQYGYNPVNSRAMIRLITGQINPIGKLPVKLSENEARKEKESSFE